MKNGIKLDKGVKITLILLVIYTCIILIILLPNYLKKQKENVFIMTNRYKIKYEKRKWNLITNSDDYKLRKFTIYQNNEYYGKYKVLFSNHFTLIDDNDQLVNYDGYIFATSGSIKTKLYNYIISNDYTINDNEIVKEALDKVKIGSNAYYNIHQKIILNYNNDDIYFYYIDNIKESNDDSIDGITGPVPNTSGNNFALLIMYKNNKVYIIDKNITPDNEFKVFEVLNVVDIWEDNNLELIYVLGDRYNTNSDCPKLYNIEKEKEIKNFCE